MSQNDHTRCAGEPKEDAEETTYLAFDCLLYYRSDLKW